MNQIPKEAHRTKIPDPDRPSTGDDAMVDDEAAL